MPTIRMGRIARSIPMARPPVNSDEPCYWCGGPYSAHGQREAERGTPPAPQVPCRGLSVYYLRRAEGIARTPATEIKADKSDKGEDRKS